jgi:SAM-dependent methyltransferase
MDRTRFSFIAHGDLRLCNPASSARVDRALERLSLRAGATVLDIGAGKGEWLARLVRRWSARGVAVEPAGLFADEARRLHADLVADGRLTVVGATAAKFLADRHAAPIDAPPSPSTSTFDAALCIGAAHAFGGYVPALEALTPLVRPGGALVFGHGHWKKKPDPAYLAALGDDESSLTSHAGVIRLALDRGLTPIWCTTVTDDEWDEYEWAYARNIENFVRDHPHDPDAPAMLARSRAWRDIVLSGGRDTLGFGLYIFRTPAS